MKFDYQPLPSKEEEDEANLLLSRPLGKLNLFELKMRKNIMQRRLMMHRQFSETIGALGKMDAGTLGVTEDQIQSLYVGHEKVEKSVLGYEEDLRIIEGLIKQKEVSE